MKILNKLECELRGCITRGDFRDIRPIIEKEWGKFDEGPELVIFFKGEHDFRLTINKKGGHLTVKKTIDVFTGTRSEIIVSFNNDQIIPVINLIDQLGFKKGLFSYCYRFDVFKANRSLSIKFNTQIGDLFEIEEIVGKNKNLKLVYNNLINIVVKYGLNIWCQETYKNIIKDSWEGVKEESLINKGKINPLITEILKEIKSKSKNILKDNRDTGDNKTIHSIIKNKSNNYSRLEKLFKKKSGDDLLSWKSQRLRKDYKKTASIIIPTFNSWSTLKLSLKSIEEQRINPDQRKRVEIIIVDDGSSDGTENKIKSHKSKFKIRYIRQENLGRVYARNLGAAVANGEILIFIDSDVLLEKNFLNEHIKRHNYLDNIVLVSFKQNISIEDSKIRLFYRNGDSLKPNIKKDFRFEKSVSEKWLRMHRHVRNIEIRNVKLIKETNNFKTFGKDNVLGVWDLPSVVTTSALSLKRSSFEKIGGFSLQFKGWGMEDTFLGACLIADGNYIIPCFSTGVFHIEYGPRSKTNENKIREFNRNVLIYLDLINQPINKIFKYPFI